jgi:short-subunit dehydrogenase
MNCSRAWTPRQSLDAPVSREPPATVLITGATGGLGRALALRYARAGRTMVLHGRDEIRLQEVCGTCAGQGAQVVPIAFDLRDIEGFRACLGQIVASTPIDLAIVNAGVSRTNGGDGETWEDVELVLDVNVRAALATVCVLVPHMLRRGHGQIALIASLAAYHGMPLTPSYCASKAALKAYGEALRGWLAPHGIAVNVVLPGFVKTPMSDAFAGAKPFMISADDAARRIQDGLARNRARISFPQPLAFGAWLLAVLPASWSQALVRRMRL